MVLPAPFAHAATVDVRCSVGDLVKAIETANSSPGADTLRLARKCTYRLTSPDATHPANGLPAITSKITIDGNGATITRAESAPDFRILLVDEKGTLTLNKTTISGGRATDCPLFPGGAVCGGGINNQGILTLNHSKVVHNAANTALDGIAVEGGGIDSDGPAATVYDTDVSYNTAIYTGRTASAADGGGIANDGPLTLNRSRVTGNTVRVAENPDSFAFGAGYAAFAKATVKDSTISGNRADAPGGTARAALTNGSPEGMTVTDTVIRGNTTSAPGGTATGGGVANNAAMKMTGTRVDDNTVTAKSGTARGGGIRNGPFGELDLKSSKVRDNTVKAEHGGTAQGGGIDNPDGGTVTTRKSDISNNTAKATNGGTAQGGGIFHATGSTTLNNSTVTGNRAGDGGGIFEVSGTVTLNNTVVKRNKPNNCAPPNSVPGCTG